LGVVICEIEQIVFNMHTRWVGVKLGIERATTPSHFLSTWFIYRPIINTMSHINHTGSLI